jgi:hypothetical protein
MGNIKFYITNEKLYNTNWKLYNTNGKLYNTNGELSNTNGKDQILQRLTCHIYRHFDNQIYKNIIPLGCLMCSISAVLYRPIWPRNTFNQIKA